MERITLLLELPRQRIKIVVIAIMIEVGFFGRTILGHLLGHRHLKFR